MSITCPAATGRNAADSSIDSDKKGRQVVDTQNCQAGEAGLPPHIVIEFKKDSRILDPIPGSQLRRLNGDASGFQLWRGVCPPETRARSYYSGSVKAQAWRSTSSSLHASTIRPFARKASPPASRCGSSGMLMQSSGLLAITICLVSRCTNCCS